VPYIGRATVQCDLGLLAKDGVWLAEVPRTVTDNKLFFSVSSRVDVAIRCPVAGDIHTFTYTHLLDASAPATPEVILTINVVASYRDAAINLPVWDPCRPAYLTDISTLPRQYFIDPFALEVRAALNNLLFTVNDDYIVETKLNMAQIWSLSVTELHPFHMHVNHMQLGAVDTTNQYPEVSDWFVANDWLDTVSIPGVANVYIRPYRYTGHMVMHCHIAQHSDYGVLGVANIVGDGDAGNFFYIDAYIYLKTNH
jgi:FtsP/CotA-like multicopper oxidase with cupredoxin domain